MAICLARNLARPHRLVSPEVIEKQVTDLMGSLPRLKLEGFRNVYVMDNAEDIESAQLQPELRNE